ncbi:shikimate dehydrogenase [Actinoplanes subtropicus]|uniref:shikimate dehydrogenase n=1 Tax=Actinoplanes subtropicus TaxID=543632 RepID=UPI0004C35EC2|nr:shikimate dehydrogenase [Actinoplanes subtropicus]
MADPCLVGLIGADIQTSLSPPLHEAEAARLGLRYWYHLIDLAERGLAAVDVGELVKAAGRLGFRGLNITHPCKQEVVKHLDDLSPEAADLDAVNTVVFTGGRAIGHNTDHYGFAESFRRSLGDAHGLGDAPAHEVLQLGAGGAGAAVAFATVRLGAGHLTIVDADADRANRLAGRLRARGANATAADLSDLPELTRAADGLVNTTPVGMEGRPGLPLDPALLRRDLWVADIVYRPLETALLRAAREAGCRTLNGGGMVVHQAAESLRLFTGRTPDVDRMLADFKAHTDG